MIIRKPCCMPLFMVVAALSAMVYAETSPVGLKWDEETLDLFARLPIQDGGRIKPLNTYASFTLLQYHGRRSCPNLAGEKLAPIAWLLDCLFFPELARQYPLFRVENSEVVASVGLPPKKKRDYYSYNELSAEREKLISLGRQFANAEGQLRSSVEKEIMALATNLLSFEALTSFTRFSRQRFDISNVAFLSGMFPGQTHVRLSDILRQAPLILAAYLERYRDLGKDSPELAPFMDFFQTIEAATEDAAVLFLFPPPPGSTDAEWLSPADLSRLAFSQAFVEESRIDLLANLEVLTDSLEDLSAFKKQAETLIGAVIKDAESRGEYGKISLEVKFYQLNLFYRALLLYILSFLVVACTWMRPHSRWLSLGAFIAVSAPTGLLLLGIVLRSIIRGRPPVTSAYETILFVCLVAVTAALFMEWANRRGLAISIGSILGVFGMFFANKYETGYGGDTMPAMIAVLDTNFWLALHVTTIAIGYGAGFLSSGLAHVFIVGRALGFRRNNQAFYLDLTRMVYGSLCFSFVFICLGTVLGGIWANESWGRFWGWDPKENGALMICLWQLTILHARMDGLIKQYGINIAAVIGGIIIAFCWFGVNMLGVGLHSYGFTSGGYAALINFYIVETIITLLGCWVWFRQRRREAQAS